jgi:DNA-binding YbaB/EbfC family protein
MNPNIKEMMRQAQIFQKRLIKAKEELAKRTIEVTVGGGMVKAIVNGKPELVSLTIEREVVDPDDIDMLQDLILAAVNEALARSKEMVDTEITKLTGGLNMPGVF